MFLRRLSCGFCVLGCLVWSLESNATQKVLGRSRWFKCYVKVTCKIFVEEMFGVRCLVFGLQEHTSDFR